MEFNGRSWTLVGVAAALAFLVVAALMMRFMPQPRQDSDYIVVGAVGTMAGLAVFLLAFLATRKSSGGAGRQQGRE